MQAVELVEVSKSFTSSRQKEFLAVDKLNLQVTQGEFFSLLGPSGCGKTTTLRMLAGFELPTSGDIYIYGESMAQLPPFHRPVNTVFQNYALFPHLTVAENIAFGLNMEKLPRSQIRERTAEALAMVKLEELGKRYPRQLSGGQQQRVALARALVKRPKVLLLDEPLGALDLKLRKQMQLELKHVQQQVGITFIYVTHDQEEALTMSDRIAVMSEGKILQIGTPSEIYEEPNSRFVADFIGETNLLTGSVVELKDETAVVLIDECLPIAVPCRDRVSIGQQVTIVIRPEKMALSNINNGSLSGWLARIEEIVYIGTDTRYLVRLTDRTAISIRQQNLHRCGTNLYRVGEQIQVNILPENMRLIFQ